MAPVLHYGICIQGPERASDFLTLHSKQGWSWLESKYLSGPLTLKVSYQKKKKKKKWITTISKQCLGQGRVICFHLSSWADLFENKKAEKREWGSHHQGDTSEAAFVKCHDSNRQGSMACSDTPGHPHSTLVAWTATPGWTTLALETFLEFEGEGLPGFL